MFAQAINSQAHLLQFELLAGTAGGLGLDKIFAFDAIEASEKIRENIRWALVKAPEIGYWVENEKGSGTKIKFHVMAFVTFVCVMLL